MSDLSRRDVLNLAAVGAATFLTESLLGTSPVQAAQANASGTFTLPPLPYAFDALAPHIDTKTMEIHHGKHHQAYVNGLNAAVEQAPELKKMTLHQMLEKIDKVPTSVRQQVINMGGGHANHTLFWEIMSPQGGGEPTGDLAKAIKSQFESMAGFREQLSAMAGKVFGSGWAWLVCDNGKLEIMGTANQDSPLMYGKTPLLGIDVWEHAYYLNYQNRRPDYVNAWFNVVNWKQVGENFAQSKNA